MANYKVALSAEVRGMTVHNDLKNARQSQKNTDQNIKYLIGSEVLKKVIGRK